MRPISYIVFWDVTLLSTKCPFKNDSEKTPEHLIPDRWAPVENISAGGFALSNQQGWQCEEYIHIIIIILFYWEASNGIWHTGRVPLL